MTGQGVPTPESFGRVAEDGTVYVRIGEAEHVVGQYPEGTPEEALAFYTRRFEGLEFEIGLLEQRIRAGALSPDEAMAAITKVMPSLETPNSVGNIAGLRGRLDALKPLIAGQREQRKADRAQRLEASRARKLEIVTLAESLASGKDWRNGPQKLRDLLEEWKALPRLERAVDDELWHRFSSARSAFTKARKSHFAQQDEKRGAAQAIKERLADEAEALSSSTEWGPTAARFRTLMQDWKAAGAAPRAVEDDLWKRFRGAQDTFFAARDAANAQLDAEFSSNAEVKQGLLVEAEALLPITDLETAKKAFRGIAERWEAAGKVPRAMISDLEGRLRKVEQAIRGAEDAQWRRSDPEKSARADDMVAKLREGIAKAEADVEKARAASDSAKVAKLESELENRRAFLAMAEKTAAEFSN
ncbi:MAG: DUF349 domain-containing protein [Marmoricola sp.]